MTGLLTSQLQMRRDTAAVWTSTNPVLAEGEIGHETDTLFHKIGDGSTAWNSLIYYHGPPWLQALDGGGPATVYTGAPYNPHGVMGYAAVIGPVDIAGESDDWYRIQAIGRHHDDSKKIVFAGVPSFGDNLTIGILDRRDGTITEITDAFAGTTMTQCSGIDCDPSTGRYVAHQNNSSGNHYYSWYADSDDLTDWTQCAMSGWNSQFHGGGMMRYDIDMGFWFWFDSIAVYISDDGATFYQQNMDYKIVTDSRMAQCWDYVAAGRFEDDVAYFAGNTERPVRFSPGGASVAPIDWEDVEAGLEIGFGNLGIIIVGDPGFNGGVDTDGDNIVMCTTGGIIIYSETGVYESWQVAAADQAGSDSNEWIDTLGLALVGSLCYVEGQWWMPVSQGGNNNWYYYDGSGIPIGYGWTQSNTGPFKVRTLGAVGNIAGYLRDPHSCRFAYVGYDLVNESLNQFRIWYDTGDL